MDIEIYSDWSQNVPCGEPIQIGYYRFDVRRTVFTSRDVKKVSFF